MRRALGEYLVSGIKTTVPFFTWLFAQPDFIDERGFTTTYLDEVLASRHGRPFVEPAPEAEDVAAIAAALHAVLAPVVASTDGAAGEIVRRPPVEIAGARAEGLR